MSPGPPTRILTVPLETFKAFPSNECCTLESAKHFLFCHWALNLGICFIFFFLF